MLNVAQESSQQQLADPRITDTELVRVDSNYSQQGGVYFAGGMLCVLHVVLCTHVYVAMLCVCMWCYAVCLHVLRCVFACGAMLCVCVCCYAVCIFAVLRYLLIVLGHAFVYGISGLSFRM